MTNDEKASLAFAAFMTEFMALCRKHGFRPHIVTGYDVPAFVEATDPEIEFIYDMTQTLEGPIFEIKRVD